MPWLLLLAACSRPPPAPETLDDLCGWLFAHHADDDPRAMEDGLASLSDWLDVHGAEAAEGYEVTGLDQPTVDALDDAPHSVADIIGVSTANPGDHPLDAALEVMLVEDQDQVHPDRYEDYDRTYDTDLDCFLDRTCDRLETTEVFEASLPFGITSHNTTANEYLWVETGTGPAVAWRAWLPVPAEVEASWLDVVDQYYLHVVLPREGGGRWHVQATWLVQEQDAVPEAMMLTQVAREMVDLVEGVEAWLEE